MGSTRGDTRQRIQDVALELFAEKGYEKSSLREIAEQLGVTKAALYYHFKTKEDILRSLLDEMAGPIDELIAWGRKQPRTLDTKRELLTRYSEALEQGSQLFRFMQENQGSIRKLDLGETFKQRVEAMVGLLRDDDADLKAQTRSVAALFTMHAGKFALKDAAGDPEEKRLAVLEVAQELVGGAYEE